MSIDLTSKPGNVIIEITKNEFDLLTLVLGFAILNAQELGMLELAINGLRLVNSINIGNPDFEQYDLDKFKKLLEQRKNNEKIRPN